RGGCGRGGGRLPPRDRGGPRQRGSPADARAPRRGPRPGGRRQALADGDLGDQHAGGRPVGPAGGGAVSLVPHLRAHLLRGLLLALPTIITLWLLRILFHLVSDNATPWVLTLLRAFGIEDLDPWHGRLLVPVIGIGLTLLVVYLLGVLATNLLGRRLLSWLGRGLPGIAVVKRVYGGSRQLLDALNLGQAGAFSRVVLVEYPRAGVWTIGFVTNENPTLVPGAAGGTPGLSVFFPTTPN